jgi:hypothetical protein
MKTFKDQFNSVEPFQMSTENEDLSDSFTSYAKPSREVPMARIESSNKLEQYYNKASGCKVKAQKDNLFDYGAAFED